MQDDSTNNFYLYNRTTSTYAMTIASATGSAIFTGDASVYGIIYAYSGLYSFNGSNDYLGVISSGGTNKILTTAGSTNRDISIAPGNSIAMTVQVTTNNVLVPTPGNVSTAVLTTDATQTVSNKRVTKRVSTTASSSTPTPNADTDDAYTITALAANATFGVPTGTPTEMQPLTIRIKDNGTARTLAFNAIYRAIGVTLPTTTTISKTMYIDMKYNLTDTKWDVLAWGVEA